MGEELVGKNLASLVADPTKCRLIMTCYVTKADMADAYWQMHINTHSV